SSFLNAFYFLPIIYQAFFSKADEEPSDSINTSGATSGDTSGATTIKEAPLWCVVPLVITAIISIILFFYPYIFVDLIKVSLGI
ncbi:MAG: hypothetical protein KAR45_03950, partial [Desulfobacteraceae bacterium]|nr:hypothetical protein [Desulfobacteraceae bacterium]